jgi:hypothetical protein
MKKTVKISGICPTCGRSIKATRDRSTNAFAQYWFLYLGWNFLRLSDNTVIRKSELIYQKKNEEFALIPFEPLTGWQSEKERKEHEIEIQKIKSENHIPDILQIANINNNN